MLESSHLRTMKNFRLLWIALVLVLCVQRASGIEGYLQWARSGEFFNFPSSSISPPIISPPRHDGSSLLVLFTNYTSTNSSWMLSGLDIATGATNWTLGIAALPANSQPSSFIAAVPPGPQPTNYLSLAFFMLGGQLYAVESQSGRLAWMHTPYNNSQPIVTGWSDATSSTVYLTYTFMDTNRVVPVQINVIEALDPVSGRLLWQGNTTLPTPSGLPQSNTASSFGLTAMPHMAAYARASRVAAISADSGNQTWAFTVGGTGFGASTANANITSVVYVEPAAASAAAVSKSSIAGGTVTATVARSAGGLLLTNTVFQSVRFLMYNLNMSLIQGPSLAWQMTAVNDFEGALTDPLIAAGLQQPVVSAADGLFYFWSNRTVYNQTTGAPSYVLTLVARSLVDGRQAWGRELQGLYLPYVKNGRVYVTTPDGLQVLDAVGGQTLWSMSLPPQDPISADGTGGSFGYNPGAAFDTLQGQLAMVRCLGPGFPAGSICAYSGFAAAPRTPTTSAASSRARTVLVSAAAVAGAATAWLL